MSLDAFRTDARTWLAENCPESMRGRTVHFEDAFEIYDTPDARLWLSRAAERGWTAPTWPTQYGGGGLIATRPGCSPRKWPPSGPYPRRSAWDWR